MSQNRDELPIASPNHNSIAKPSILLRKWGYVQDTPRKQCNDLMCRFELLGALVLLAQDLLDKFTTRKESSPQCVSRRAAEISINKLQI